jgi:DNA-binding NarL/FixJ family response regulator
MNPINVVVIDQYRPGAPDSAIWLDDDQEIHVAARSSRLDDSGALCASHHPDVLLVSTRCLPDSSTEWLTEVHRQCATTRIILTDDALTDEALVDCLGTGARGWVEASDTALVGKAVHAVHLGDAWVSRKLARQLVDRLIERERSRAD